jgi:hypothetical protein
MECTQCLGDAFHMTKAMNEEVSYCSVVSPRWDR